MLIPYTFNDKAVESFLKVAKHSQKNDYVYNTLMPRFEKEYIYLRTFVAALIVHKISDVRFKDCLRNIFFDVKGLYSRIPDNCKPKFSEDEFEQRVLIDYGEQVDHTVMIVRKFLDEIYKDDIHGKLSMSQYADWVFQDTFETLYAKIPNG